MQKSKSLFCYHCNLLVAWLKPSELKKLNSLHFRCDCCGHENSLVEGILVKGTGKKDPFVNSYSLDVVEADPSFEVNLTTTHK